MSKYCNKLQEFYPTSDFCLNKFIDKPASTFYIVLDGQVGIYHSLNQKIKDEGTKKDKSGKNKKKKHRFSAEYDEELNDEERDHQQSDSRDLSKDEDRQSEIESDYNSKMKRFSGASIDNNFQTQRNTFHEQDYSQENDYDEERRMSNNYRSKKKRKLKLENLLLVQKLATGEVFGAKEIIMREATCNIVRALKKSYIGFVPRQQFIKILGQFESARVKAQFKAFIAQAVFQGCEESILVRIFLQSYRVSLRQGEKLFNEGDKSDNCYLTRRGEFALYKKFYSQTRDLKQARRKGVPNITSQSDSGNILNAKITYKTVKVMVITENELVGNEEILEEEQVRQFTLVAQTSAEAILIPLHVLRQEMNFNMKLANAIVNTMHWKMQSFTLRRLQIEWALEKFGALLYQGDVHLEKNATSGREDGKVFAAKNLDGTVRFKLMKDYKRESESEEAGGVHRQRPKIAQKNIQKGQKDNGELQDFMISVSPTKQQTTLFRKLKRGKFSVFVKQDSARLAKQLKVPQEFPQTQVSSKRGVFQQDPAELNNFQENNEANYDSDSDSEVIRIFESKRRELLKQSTKNIKIHGKRTENYGQREFLWHNPQFLIKRAYHMHKFDRINYLQPKTSILEKKLLLRKSQKNFQSVMTNRTIEEKSKSSHSYYFNHTITRPQKSFFSPAMSKDTARTQNMSQEKLFKNTNLFILDAAVSNLDLLGQTVDSVESVEDQKSNFMQQKSLSKSKQLTEENVGNTQNTVYSTMSSREEITNLKVPFKVNADSNNPSTMIKKQHISPYASLQNLLASRTTSKSTLYEAQQNMSTRGATTTSMMNYSFFPKRHSIYKQNQLWQQKACINSSSFFQQLMVERTANSLSNYENFVQKN